MPRNEALLFRLYAITDRRACAPQSLSARVDELLRAGVRGFQVREKDLERPALQELAGILVRIGRAWGARILVNAAPDLALAAGADGVHLPAAAPPVDEVRGRSSGSFLVGCSVHRPEEAVERERQGADFVLFGPVYPSPSKPGYGPAAGTAGLAKVARGLSIPVFALGGVSPERVPECLDAGAYGVAVMSGLMQADRPAACAQAYLEELGRACSRS